MADVEESFGVGAREQSLQGPLSIGEDGIVPFQILQRQIRSVIQGVSSHVKGDVFLEMVRESHTDIAAQDLYIS